MSSESKANASGTASGKPLATAAAQEVRLFPHSARKFPEELLTGT
jgi:hypothetical protein